MTRLSQYLLPTEKQPPADAEALSHKLLVRAGMIRQLGAGLWTWMPAGWRVHQNVVQIIREEMNAIGGLEMLMPVLHPAELWQRSGRYAIPELLKLQDRRGAELVLAMTHEENITFHMASIVRSYRDLPQILYHFQTKERDEPRPRAAVLRTREFIMKDAYTFDRDAEGLEVGYAEAHPRLRPDLRALRAGLVPGRVRRRDDGRHGRARVHGALPGGRGRRSRSRPATPPTSRSRAPTRSRSSCPPGCPSRRWRQTPGADHRGGRRAARSASPPARCSRRSPSSSGRTSLRLVMLRGDHRVNETKLRNAIGADVPARAAGRVRGADRPRRATSARSAPTCRSCSTPASRRAPTSRAPTVPTRICAASSRAATSGSSPPTSAPSRRATPSNGAPIRIEPAIEVGNIFKLGTRYSDALGATYLDEAGKERAIWMGSYGLGPARIAAAAVEQFADEHGISWPRSMAPFDIELVGLGKEGTEERKLAERLYEELQATGLDIVYDDRDAGPGTKFADAELLGVPLRLTVGRRTLEAGEIEAQVRRGREQRSVPLDGAAEAAADLWRDLP